MTSVRVTGGYLEVESSGGGRPEWGGPVDPGYGRPEGGRPGHELPGFPGTPGHPGNRPPGSYPGRPGQGLPSGGRPDNSLPSGGHIPLWPLGPGQGLPPIAGHPLPPVDPPPGTIWPPLEPGDLPDGTTKALVLAFIEGVGYHYVVIEISTGKPDQSLPGGRPPVAGQPLPPTAQPKRS